MEAKRFSRKVILLTFFLICSANSFAQEISAKNTKISYDENLNLTITATLKNLSRKTITNVFLLVCFESKRNNAILPVPFRESNKKLSVKISPSSSKQISIYVSNPGGDFVYRSTSIEKIRYSDGSIWEPQSYLERSYSLP